MATDIKLQPLGDGIDSGDVLDVLVKEGDTIAKDQGIIELETGKATIQVPASHGGKIVKVHVKKGQTVPIGTVLLTVETAAGAASAVAPVAAPPKKTTAPVQPAAPAPAAAPVAVKPAAVVAAPVTPPPTPVAVAPVAPPPLPEEDHDDGSIAAGPAVRRFAREVGIDLRRVTGTGSSGRITREDVLAAVRIASQAGAQSGHGKPKSTATSRDQWGPIRAEKMSRIRKTIAEQMHKSWTSVPRVTNFDDADVTELERIRLSSKDDYAEKGIKLTSLPFLIKAVAMSLRAHPAVNATVDMANDQIVYKEYVNVGIAVDTERGLVVPSLRSADEMSIPDIARALAQLAENVRTNNFTLGDLQGSTFTISNLGAIGGTYSTPIINIPEVAILLVGRARKMPIVLDDKIEIRLMMPLSLSYDHRLVDGATAARFLNDVMGFLKAPSRLLLAP